MTLSRTKHTTNITNVVRTNTTTATITVNSATGISVGHHVQLSSIGGATRLNYTVSRNNIIS